MGLTTLRPVPQIGPDVDTREGIRIEVNMIRDLVVDRENSLIPVSAREYRKAADAADRLGTLLRKAARATLR